MKTLPKERRYETFSYLPPLTDQQISRQIDYMIQQGYIPCIEFNEASNPEEYYWTMWKLPLFSSPSVQDVLSEVNECRTEYRDCYIRIVGFDNIRQCQVVTFIVHRPGSSNFRY